MRRRATTVEMSYWGLLEHVSSRSIADYSWAHPEIQVGATASLSKESVTNGAFDATYRMGEMKHTSSLLPRYVLPVVNTMSLSRNVAQAHNPGYGYTNCYIRLYAPSQKALKGDMKRLEEVWKVMQYFGPMTIWSQTLGGKSRVMKSMALDSRNTLSSRRPLGRH